MSLGKFPTWSKETATDRNHKPQCASLPSSTVTKSWSGSPQERYVTSAEGIRQLTPPEVFRLQGFPEGWFDVPGIAPSVRVALAGNAVPPPVAEAVFASLPLRGRVMELFAGAGGMALGAERAGFEVSLLVDLWKPACAVLNKHFAGRVACQSVDTLPFERLRGFKVLSGGPPCQPYSRGGKRLGPDDPRDRCTALPLILGRAQPDAFVFEESDALFTHAKGEYWKHLARSLRAAKYRVGAMLINAHDYGVPQIRCRAFVVGLRDGSPAAWADRMLARARPGQGGVVADVMEEGSTETWGPWAYGCRRPKQHAWCPTQIVEADR